MLGTFLVNCSHSDSTNNLLTSSPSNEVLPKVEVAKAPNKTDTMPNRTDRVIMERSLDYGLLVLRDKHLDTNDYELRFWSSIDLMYYEKCLIVRRTNGHWRAEFIKPLIMDGELIRSVKGAGYYKHSPPAGAPKWLVRIWEVFGAERTASTLAILAWYGCSACSVRRRRDSIRS